MDYLTTKKKYICVEGLIGSGKTTLCKELAKYENTFGKNPLVQLEPAEGENPYLADYYSDPKSNAFKMQIYLLSKRYRAHLAAQSLVLSGVCSVIADRSYFGDRCFAEVQLQDGYFTETDFKTYLTLHKDMQRDILYPSAFVYLMVPVSLAMERIAKRMSEIEGRKCECSISYEYMMNLDRAICKMMDAMSQYCPVIKIRPFNSNNEERSVKDIAAEVAVQLRCQVLPKYESWQGVE